MLYSIIQLQQKLFQPVYDVYTIFQDFFGEEHTDLQGTPSEQDLYEHLQIRGIKENEEHKNHFDISEQELTIISDAYSEYRFYILVWWPEVTVTNENDKSVKIQDLYAKIPVTIEGFIAYESTGFQLTRSTFSELQYSSGYIHSHVPRRYNDVPTFQNPCLGSGPIKNTINNLKQNNDETIWMLFCQELALYVTVESLTGVPYFKLESINSSTTPLFRSLKECADSNTFYILSTAFTTDEEGKQKLLHLLSSFIDYYLSLAPFPISFVENRYQCLMPDYDFMINISNAFISWFNTHGTQEQTSWLFDSKILIKAFVRDNTFYKQNEITPSEIQRNSSRPLLYFKEQPVYLNILQGSNNEQQSTILLNPKIAVFVKEQILKVINYRYVNKQLTSNNPEESATTSSTSYQTVYYV